MTFGDESAIRPDRAASFISILTVFLLWGAFTGSKLVPFHVPGPFIGDTSFSFEAKDDAGQMQSGRSRSMPASIPPSASHLMRRSSPPCRGGAIN